MAIVKGTYESVVKGVSDQAPYLRFSGQVSDQVNMIPDVVKGLSRRKGTSSLNQVYLHELFNLTNVPDSVLAELGSYKSFVFKQGNTDYLMIYRTTPSALSDTYLNNVKPYYIFNLTTKQFVRTRDFYDLGLTSEPVEYAITKDWYRNGFNAVIQSGGYVLMAGKLPVKHKETNNFSGTVPLNTKEAVIEIRDGSYSTTYTVNLYFTDSPNTPVTVTYKTPASSYPNALNIPSGADATTIAKLTSEYNAAATAYIGSALDTIRPEAIANALRTRLSSYVGVAQRLSGESVIYIASNKAQGHARDLFKVTVSDGSTDTTIVACDSEIVDETKLTTQHRAGHIVKIIPKSSTGKDAYYLKAVPVNPKYIPNSSNYNYTHVKWQETAGVVQELVAPFGMGLVADYFGIETFSISPTPDMLNRVMSDTSLPPDYPKLVPSMSGDVDTNPPPFFASNLLNSTKGLANTSPITFMAMFQDRLVIGSGGYLSFSQAGDYFNFYRDSVLTLVDADPVDVTPNDAGGDALTDAVLFDRSLYVFGSRRQYIVNGKAALTPSSININVVSSVDNTDSSSPISVNNNIYFAKPSQASNKNFQLYQLQYGQISDTVDSYPLGSHVTSFLEGNVIELVGFASPNVITLRVKGSGDAGKLYHYRYLIDPDGGQRLLSAWDTWDVSLGYEGYICGSCNYKDALTLVTLTKTGVTGGWWLSLQTVDHLHSDSKTEFLDMRIPYAINDSNNFFNLSPVYANEHVWVQVVGGVNDGMAVPYALREQMTSDVIADGALYAGANYTSYAEMTNPFIKDNNGIAQLTGRLTVSRIEHTVVDTGGLEAIVTANGKSTKITDFNGVVNSQMGITVEIPAVATYSGTLSTLIGKETRSYSLVVKSKPSKPMTITAWGWSGQYFSR